MRISDWSSDVCSSDLAPPETEFQVAAPTPFSTPLQRTSKTASQHRAASHSISSFDGSSAPSTPFPDDELHVIPSVEATDECDDDDDCLEIAAEPKAEPSTEPVAEETQQDRKRTRLNSSH